MRPRTHIRGHRSLGRIPDDLADIVHILIGRTPREIQTLRVVKHFVFEICCDFVIGEKYCHAKKNHALLKIQGFFPTRTDIFQNSRNIMFGKKRCILKARMFYFERIFIFQLRKIKLRARKYTFFRARIVIFQLKKYIEKSCVT